MPGPGTCTLFACAVLLAGSLGREASAGESLVFWSGTVESITERAIDLFDDHVRKNGDEAASDSERVTMIFRTLLPQVTRLVALHFQRTLVRRALDRLADSSGDDGLRDALTATGGNHLSVDVEWR